MLPLMATVGFSLLLLGFPFFVILVGTSLVTLLVFLPDTNLLLLVQQVVSGVKPASLVCIPMFILAGDIITSGQAITKLIELVKAMLGHIPGGSTIVTSVSCAIFGALSGSTQASVAAIGKTMRPMMMKEGYSSSFSLGLIISASNLAWLIPPSIGFIVYGVATRTSIGQLFLAGVGPGLVLCLVFCIYGAFYSIRHKIPLSPRSTWEEKGKAFRGGIPVLGFPLVILGGIYSGYFSPTEAAAAGVLYALILEGVVYRSLSLEKIRKIALSTGVITSVVFVLVGGGQAISWVLSYARIPQTVLPSVFGADPSALKVIIVINIVYFIAGMFVDPIVSIYVLSPIFASYVSQAGIDPVFLGVLVCLQGAFAGVTPPCGCNIFTAMVIFRRPYLEVIRNLAPFVIIMIIMVVLLIIFPDIALFLPNSILGS
ncbi:MAG: TRAP transporter large permease [Thermovirga sp.]